MFCMCLIIMRIFIDECVDCKLWIFFGIEKIVFLLNLHMSLIFILNNIWSGYSYARIIRRICFASESTVLIKRLLNEEILYFLVLYI